MKDSSWLNLTSRRTCGLCGARGSRSNAATDWKRSPWHCPPTSPNYARTAVFPTTSTFEPASDHNFIALDVVSPPLFTQRMGEPESFTPLYVAHLDGVTDQRGGLNRSSQHCVSSGE